MGSLNLLDLIMIGKKNYLHFLLLAVFVQKHRKGLSYDCCQKRRKDDDSSSTVVENILAERVTTMINFLLLLVIIDT
jgi:hypothetical protein